jgi:hypothetical protein
MVKSSDVFIRPDGSVLLNSGQVLIKTHNVKQCSGEYCPMHKPSDHALRGEQLYFNGRYMIRRVGGDLFLDPDDYFSQMDSEAILQNSVLCLSCFEAIESRHRHDYQTCSCGTVSVDGGYSYLGRSFKEPDSYLETSVVIDLEAQRNG